MITKNEMEFFKTYFECENINGVFDLVLDLIREDKNIHAENMIGKMSQRQRHWFSMYLEDSGISPEVKAAESILNDFD